MSSSVSPNRFADYFVICGLDVSSGLEPDRLSGDNLHCQPLERPYKCKVLAHYPESVPWNPFDKEAVGMLSLPKGLTFRTQKQTREAMFHSFIITKEDGSRVFGSTLTFFEEVKNTRICAAMQTLHAMHKAELSNAQSRTLYSHLGEEQERSPQTTRRRPPRGTSDRFYDINKDSLYVTKAVSLITQLPFVYCCRHFLTQLYEAITSESPPQLPLECYIFNILFEVPLPPPGRSMKFFGVSSPIFCQRPSVIELPVFDFSLWELFKILGLENVLKLFTSVLLEHQVLLYSSDYQRLMLIAESCTNLMFPFSWQHVYVPILPASLHHFLDAPVPFIMGLQHGREDRSQLKLPSEANMCFVDIDACSVEIPEFLPAFPYKQEIMDELSQLIAKYHPVLDKPVSTNSYTQTLGRYKRLKSHDPDTNRLGKVSNGNTTPQSPSKLQVLQQSEAWARIAAIAKKTGVWTSLEDLTDTTNKNITEKVISEPKEPTTMPARDLDELAFNNCVREIFLNCFVHMFRNYEAFVIQPTQDMESWLNNRETMHNFDKAAFLSDQPDGHLPFLSPFTETQMFATLIDNKIMSQWEEADTFLRVFEARLKSLRDKYEEGRSPALVPCTTFRDTEAPLEKRATYIDHIATRPHMPPMPFEHAKHEMGVFPNLSASVLNSEPIYSKSRNRENAMWRRKDRLLQHSEHLKLNSDQRELLKFRHSYHKYIQEARSKVIRQPRLADMNAAHMAQTNWKFVETLLKECKSKTKRMLVDKMGREAVELGHGEVSITGVEENTLIASLCDLLERIWGHGLQTKKGKSALWSHMLSFQEVEECNDTSKPIDPNFLTPVLTFPPLRRQKTVGSRLNLVEIKAMLECYFSLCNLSSMALEAERTIKEKTHRRKGSRGGIDLPTLRPLPRSLTFDMKNVQQMSDIKTDVGYARAFVRLALEKKMLSAHLKELLSDTELLRSLYKRYAFLRCEDEREQFLFHLLSLNAVDYFCFTNTFANTMVSYRVMIFPSTKMGSQTSANPWVNVAGHLGETGVVEIPKGLLEFTIQHKNLGVLTTLRIGHDNGGMTPRWMVEHVLVRNELTGHAYKFPCGRWLGKGVDDGSIERLLVAELVPQKVATDTEDLLTSCRTPPRCRSPSVPRGSTEAANNIPELQEMLGHAVNNIVKHFYKPEKERGNLTYLLCGEKGLVNCLEAVFLCGFRSSRLFRNKFFIWDYLERVKVSFETIMEDSPSNSIPDVAKAGYWLYCNLLNKINNASQTVGKDGKFQIFVCAGIRDHCLQRWFPLMANTTATAQMYEENSFMRNPSLTNFLVQILDTLNEFTFTLETSLTRGLDV
ncbi:DENN domain-containing protein 5B-like isoform X2 [Liolophura sinensis]|uniref:DENN domain-containing protein 5B-like isoform X2 n=1 Tax=Liolophura sinensis TaxID=3198878 RepID=UPI0031585C28